MLVAPKHSLLFIVSMIIMYGRARLQANWQSYNRLFAQYRIPESEASHELIYGDLGLRNPRKAFLINDLGCGKGGQVMRRAELRGHAWELM